MRHVVKHLLGVLLLSTAVGCAPGGGSSDVQLKFPDWKAMRAADLARQSKVSSLAVDATQIKNIFVNVTGPGIAQPILFSWENSESGGNTPPSSISLAVPSGEKRLVQVLALYGGDGGTAFYYDDDTVDLSSDRTVKLELENIVTQTNAIEGQVMGRFMRLDGTGPTANFQYRFNPPGKPSLVVHEGEIFGGWAKLFSFNSPLLSYTLADGTSIPLLEGVHNAEKNLFSNLRPQRSVAIRVPAGLRERQVSGGTQYEPKPERRIVAGFFGPGAGNRTVCVPNSSSTSITEFYFGTSASPTQMKFVPPLVTPTPGPNDARVEAMIASDGVTSIQGGLLVSDEAACTDASNFENSMYAHVEDLAHEDGLLRFQGPFRFVSSSLQEFVPLTQNSVNRVGVTWAYLPGATERLSGVGVFYRQQPLSNDEDFSSGDKYLCNQMQRFGFTEQFVAIGSTTTEINTTIPHSNLQVVLCPKSAVTGLYFNTGVRSWGGSGGGGGSYATKLHLRDLSGRGSASGIASNLVQSACSPFVIESVNDSGVPQSFADPSTQINLQVSVGAGLIYSDSTCSGTGSATHTIGRMWKSQTLYFNTSASTGSTFTIAASVDRGTVTSATFFGMSQTSEAATRIAAIGPAQIKQHGCYPVTFQAQTSSGSPAGFPGDSTKLFNLPATSQLKFYDGGDFTCMGNEVSAIDFGDSTAPHKTSRNLFFSYAATSPVEVKAINYLSFPGIDVETAKLSYSAPTPVSAVAPRIRITMPDNFAAESCVKGQVYLVDGLGDATTNSSGTAINYTFPSTPGGNYFGNDACNAAAAVQIPAGVRGMPIYFKATAPGNYTIGVNTASNGSYSFTANVIAAVANRVRVILPGQTMDETTKVVTGLPFPAYAARAYNIELVALTPGNHIDTGFNLQPVNFGVTPNFGLSSVYWMPPGRGVAAYNNFSSTSMSIGTGGIDGYLNETAQTIPVVSLPNKLNLYAATSTSYHCQAMLVTPTFWNVNSPTVSGMSFTWGASGLSSNPDCNAGGTITLPGNTLAMIVYTNALEPSNYANPGITLVSGTTLALTPIIGGVTAGAATGTFDSYRLLGPHDPLLGSCQPYAVHMSESSGNMVRVAGDVEITLSNPSEGALFVSPTCTSGGLSSLTVPFDGNEGAKIFYYRHVGAVGSAAQTLRARFPGGGGGKTDATLPISPRTSATAP